MTVQIKRIRIETAQSIGETIRYLRTQQGLTIQQLADKSGISMSAISKWENGKRIPSFENFVKIVLALDSDVFIA